MQKLSLDLYTPVPQVALDAIRSCVKSNNELKELTLSYGSVINDEFLSGNRIKLTKFEAFNLSFDGLHSLEIFNKFLMTQKDSIEILDITGLGPIVVALKTCLTMFRLKELYLNARNDLNESYEFELGDDMSNFPKNLLTSDLSFLGFNFSANSLKIVLKTFSNTKSLTLERIDDENVDEIAKTCKSLKDLCVSIFDTKNPFNEKFYVNLEMFCADNMDSRTVEKIQLKRDFKLLTSQPLMHHLLCLAAVIVLVAIILTILYYSFQFMRNDVRFIPVLCVCVGVAVVTVGFGVAALGVIAVSVITKIFWHRK